MREIVSSLSQLRRMLLRETRLFTLYPPPALAKKFMSAYPNAANRSTFKPDNVVTRLVLLSGRLLLASMDSTERECQWF